MQLKIKTFSTILLTVLAFIQVSYGYRTLKIGAIFENDDAIREIAFKKSVEDANQSLRNSNKGITIDPVIRKIPNKDSFQATKQACNLLKLGVVAIVGPSSSRASSNVQAVCSRFQVPQIETGWNYREPDFKGDGPFAINLNPHYSTYGKAILDYLNVLGNWDQLGIIYKEEENLLKFESLLKRYEHRVILRQWKEQDGTYKYVLKQLRSTKMFRFLVDIPHEDVVKFLIAASAMNMTSQYHAYIFTSWDIQRLDLKDFKVANTGANFSTFSMMPLKDNHQKYDRGQNVENMREEIFNLEATQAKKKQIYGPVYNMLPIKAATLYDSILVLAGGLNSLEASQTVTPESFDCFPDIPEKEARFWRNGASLLNEMRAIRPHFAGLTLTGPVKFDVNWKRTNFTMYIMDVTYRGFEQFGVWTPSEGFKITKTYTEQVEELAKTLQNKTLRVTTVPDPPFTMVKERDEFGNPLPHPSAWRGFCIDMLNLIAEDLGFNYTVHIVRDKKYGAVDKDKSNTTDGVGEVWNGMIGELMDHTADLAAASLTITYERERVIDFTTPFMSLGLSILFKKPEKSKPHLFSFLQPLSAQVWAYMFAAYVFVSFILFVVARFSPYEWYNPHPCVPESDVVENQFSLLNSMWFTIGSLMQQGSDIAPRSVSTRIVSGIWWFFTLIMISSYTANLAAFLTVERMQSPIENAEDLAAQVKIKYGTMASGSTFDFFQKSTIPTFKRMWDFMKARPDVFVNTTEAGVQAVRNGGYAFILESTMNEYYTQRECDLMQVGGLLDSKGYGIGLPSGSPYRDMISESILKFQKLQKLEIFRRYWWREYNVSEPCVVDDKKTELTGLGIDQVAGVYVLLLAGMLLGFLFAALEFVLKARKRAEFDRQPLMTEIMQELKFAVRCFGSSTRPTNHLQQRALRAREKASSKSQINETPDHDDLVDSRCFRCDGNRRPAESNGVEMMHPSAAGYYPYRESFHHLHQRPSSPFNTQQVVPGPYRYSYYPPASPAHPYIREAFA